MSAYTTYRVAEDAEPGAAPDRGRQTGFARRQGLAAAPAGELER